MAMIVPYNDLFRDIRTNKVYEDQACTKRVGELRGAVLERDDEPATPPTPPAETATPVVEPRIVIKEYYHAEVMDQLLKAPAEVISNKDRAMLKKYHNARVRDSVPAYVEVLYKERPVVSRVSMGRRYPAGPSLMWFPSQIRSALATGMVEIDQKNSHPHIALFYMKKHGLPHQHMEHYINNREEVLQSIHTDRAVAKEAVLKVLFGSKDVPGALTGLASELSTLAKCIHQISEYLWTRDAVFLKEMAEASKQDPKMPPAYKTDPKVRALSYLLQTEETRISDAITQFCADQGLQVALRLHDGVFIRGDVDDAFLRAAEEHITASTGYAMPLGTKPCKCTLTFAPETNASTRPPSDLEAADIFMKACGTLFAYQSDKTLFTYKAACGLWKVCDDLEGAVVSCIQDMRDDPATSTFLLFHVSEKIKIDYSLTSKVRAMLPYIRQRIIKDHSVDLDLDTAMYKFAFKNGIVDMRTGDFTPGFDKNIVFLHAIPIDYNIERNEENIEYARRIWMSSYEHDGYEPAGLFFLQYCALGLVGEYERRKMFVALGPPRSGKGNATEALIQTFGGYVGAWDACDIQGGTMGTGGRDKALKMDWVGTLRGCRIAVCNEAPEGKTTLHGPTIKSLVSGGDRMVVREIYGKKAPISNRSMLILFANDIPAITPRDEAVDDRIVYARMSTVFVDIPTLPHHRKADPKIKQVFKDPEMQLAFFHLMMQTYMELPQHVKNGGEVYEPPQAKEERVLQTEHGSWEELLERAGYEVTRNMADYVFRSDLCDDMIEHGSATKVGREMKALLPAVSKNDRIGARHVYYGVKKRSWRMV